MSNVVVYLLDTGINWNHPEFDLKSGGSIQCLWDFSAGNGDDTFGHGSHMASQIVGRHVGLAPKADLFFVKISHKLSTRIEILIEGLLKVLQHQKSLDPSQSSFLCLPLVTKKNPFVDRLVNRFIDNEGVCIAAAGNEGVEVDGCSPGSMEQVVTIGTANSNFGTNVNVVYDGQSLKGARGAPHLDYFNMDGTSPWTAQHCGLLMKELYHEK